MLHHVFSAACQSAAVDQFTNSISIQNVVEKLDAAAPDPVPVTDPPQAIPFRFFVVSLWFNPTDSEAKTTQRFRMKAPDGTTTSPGFEVTLAVQPRAGQRIVAQVPGILYRGNGVYWIEIDVRKRGHWESVAKLPMIVEVATAKPGGTSSI
jgi:hypothetical protein